MKIKVVIVDLELSKRAKRVGAAVAVVLLAVGAGAVAYGSVPKIWNDGDTLTATDLNANFAALAAALDRPNVYKEQNASVISDGHS